MSKKVVVSSIKPEATVDIKVSGAFMSRLQLLYFDMVKDLDPEELKKVMSDIISKRDFKEHEHFSYNLQTVVILANVIDEEFKKRGLVTNETVEIKEE